MNYTEKDLITLQAGEAFRLKIGMYLSADLQEAINLGLRELIVNAQDEYEVYKPKNAYVKICLNTKERTISVEDNLRGIPVGQREDGENSLIAAFLLPHSGAKHNEGAYTSSVGVNGIGNKVVCHTAEWMRVLIRREGKAYKVNFKSADKGAFVDGALTTSPLTDKTLTGTYIKYKPDSRVYGNIFIDISQLKNMLTEMSLFARGLKIILDVDGTIEEFLSKNGLIDGLKNENAISKPFSYFYETPQCQVELALQWVQKGGSVKGYANGLYMPDGGAFMTAFKTSLTRQFNSLANSKFEGERIRSSLSGFCSVKVRVGQFTNQQKTALANPEAREPVSKAVAECLQQFSRDQAQVFENLIAMFTKIEKAEVAAERARIAVMQSTKEIERTQKKKVFESDKLKDATTLGKDSILLICEGKSAVGTLSQARDYEKYGLLEIRGKIINALSNPMDKIMDNAEVKLLFSALGVTPNEYKANKLRYGKVGIASDSDQDGNHIALLLLAFFAELLPEMLKEGRIYRLESPTHIVTNGIKHHYYYSTKDFTDKKINGITTLVKGLGELTADQAKESMFGIEQRLIPFKWNGETDVFLRELMGSDIEPRKNYLFNHVDFSTIIE